MTKWIIPSLAALSCSLPFIRAQEANILAPLVVTATGSEQSLFNTSLPVNLLETRDLDEKVAISLNELFQQEPGVDAITAGPGSIQPVIRAYQASVCWYWSMGFASRNNDREEIMFSPSIRRRSSASRWFAGRHRCSMAPMPSAV